MAGRGTGPDFVEALARGLDVLSSFDERHPRMTLTQIAAAADLARPTARRLVLTLQELGYIRAEGCANIRAAGKTVILVACCLRPPWDNHIASRYTPKHAVAHQMTSATIGTDFPPHTRSHCSVTVHRPPYISGGGTAALPPVSGIRGAG